MAKTKVMVAIALVVVLLAMLVVPVYAATIRIEAYSTGYPAPTMVTSPATFNISDVSKTDLDPHVLLVVTPECYAGMSWPVTVTWPGMSAPLVFNDFTFAENSKGNKIPAGVEIYTVASCADHLGVSGSDVYYATGEFLENPISSTKQEFTVTASSTSLRMLVYAYGWTDNPGHLNCVPPSQVGFVVPEPATLALMGSLFAAFGLFAYKRRKID